MANISKLNVQGTAYNLHDAESLHYIGKINALPSESTTSITTDIVTGHTIAKYDYIVVGTDRLNYVCTAVTTSGDPAATTVTWTLISEKAAEVSVKGVKVNGTELTPDTQGIVDIPAATDSAFGVVKTGDNITNTAGVISVEVATDSVFGVVKTGTNITNTSGVISVADATTTGKGVVQIGSNIDVNNGTISVADATSSVKGVVQTGANITNTDGVISVADATSTVKGVVQLSTAIPSDPTTAVDTKAATEKAVADAIDAIPVKDVKVNGTSVVDSADQIAKVVINAATVVIDSTTAANNALPDGVKATTQQTSDDSDLLATTAYVHDLFDDIANPMIFKGNATLTADSTDPTTAAITVSGTVKKGYTYKITDIAASPAYTGNLKVGDTIIADKDNPKVTADWVAGTDWTVVPSGDENDGTVMSVAASAASGSNLTVSVKDTTTHSTSAITEAGSITVGIATGYQLLADADKTKIDTIGTSSAVYNSVTASDTAAASNSVAPARVGTNTGVDDDTLYIDFLNFGTAAVVGEATT